MAYRLDGIVNLFAFSIGNRELMLLLVSVSRGKVAGPGDRCIFFCSLAYNKQILNVFVVASDDKS